MTKNDFAYKAHKNAQEKGFWENKLSIEHCLMLVVTEVSECVEADRKGKKAHRVLYSMGFPTVLGDYEIHIKGTVEDEIADIAIRLADLAGALGIDFDKLRPCNYHRAFEKFTFTENAFALIKGLCRDKIAISKRILFGLDYVFNWAKSLNIDLWFFIEQKMKYNALRPRLHGKIY